MTDRWPDIIDTDAALAMVGNTIGTVEVSDQFVEFTFEDGSKFKAYGFQDDGFGASYEPPPYIPRAKYLGVTPETTLPELLDMYNWLVATEAPPDALDQWWSKLDEMQRVAVNGFIAVPLHPTHSQ